MDTTEDSHSSSPPVAFAITLAAGAATWVGALVVFIPVIVQKTSARVFAAALGLSAGFLAYISTIKIFVESYENFVSSGLSEGRAYAYTTICFFGGAVGLKMIDVIVSIISRLQYETYKVKKSSTSAHVAKPDFDVNMDLEADGPIGGTQDDKVIPHCVGCSKDPVAELNELKAMAEMKAREGLDRNSTTGSHCTTLDEERVPPVLRLPSQNYHSEDHHHHNEACHLDVHHHHEPHLQNTAENPNKDESSKKVQVAFLRTDDHTKLIRMGLSIGIAITLHNVPEGFATFFSAIDDTRIGVLLAVAIALHNLPMGICICFPIYYATGQRWKGFLWGFAIGLTQPIAALFGWLMINDSISDDKYGIIFGIVGGLMLMIALKELLPTAHKYDPEDSVVTYSLLCGMGIMALSLVLFEVA